MNINDPIAAIRTLGLCSGAAKLTAVQSMLGGPSELRPYVAQNRRFLNLYRVHGEGRPVVALTAHHDTVRPKSDNCLDNNASVYNLAMIDRALTAMPPPFGVVVGFVDGEETCSSELFGVGPLVQEFEPQYLVDLELTARGDRFVYCAFGDIRLAGAEEVQMPLNNARMAWRKNFPSLAGAACVTMVDRANYNQIQNTGYCDLWGLCHDPDDRAELAEPVQMTAFRDWLVGLLIGRV